MNSGGTYFESLAEGVSQGRCSAREVSVSCHSPCNHFIYRGLFVAGLCNMSDVDKALEHTLGLRFELGLFDPIEDQP